MGVLLGLALLASINLELAVFPQKFASHFAFDWFNGQESELDNSTFALPAIISSLGFYLTSSWHASIGVNVSIVTLLFLYVYRIDRRLAFLVLSPSVVNFSMFALRDPLILLFFFLFCMVINRRQISLFFVTVAFSTVSLGLRPENIVIIVGSAALIMIMRVEKISTRLTLAVALSCSCFILLPFIPRLLGLEQSISFWELYGAIDQFYYSRATRWDTDDGGGSNILNGALVSFPLYIRYPIQVLSMFILPFPWEVRSPAMALAFLDSILFIALTYDFNKKATLEHKIIFWGYILAFAFFMSNYGNAFRMRMPAYGILIAGLISVKLNERLHAGFRFKAC
jgi:hypothetical protein